MFLLDTNAISELARHPEGIVSRRTIAAPRPVVTSVIVIAEVRFGYERRPSLRLERQIASVLGRIEGISFSTDATHTYARLRADLERRGTPIGANDLFIAAHALSLGATLVTDNVREFGRVDGLVVENWLRS